MNNINWWRALFAGSFFTFSICFAQTRHSGLWGLEAMQIVKTQKLIQNLMTNPQRKIVVAVIDTGIDDNHHQFNARLWTNPGESGPDAKGRDKAHNGIDDDGNGFIDDVHGWNFIEHSANLQDHHGHGTHISGIISSISLNATIMTLKYYDAEVEQKTAASNIDATVKALRYAIAMHADIINFSGGGPGKNIEEEAALKEAEKAGILVVAAAGNEGHNTDQLAYYPADYGLSNIISVGSHNENLQLLSSSNFGKKTVDMAAPGERILSSLPGNSEGLMTGTSQATAFVSGAAALLLAQTYLGPKKRVAENIKRRLINTGTTETSFTGKLKNAVRLNSYQALSMKESGSTALGQELQNPPATLHPITAENF